MLPIDLDNELVSESQLVTYFIFIQIYDYFAEKGWPGPDGRGNPCMLQFDTSGESNGNASYAKFQQGFHIFNFGIEDSASQSMQVLAHEYFHGVSTTNHIGIYENETGTLDEALSDIIGNAVETDIEGLSMDQNVWIQTFRNLHTYQNPLYIWDEFYTPPIDDPDYENDQGNVHSNSTVISILAWRMYDAGMSASEVFDFWFTFDLVLTPNTDFAGTAARVPWIAEISGLSEYAPLLAQAVSDLHLGEAALPDILPEHQGLLLIENPAEGSSVLAKISGPDNDIDFQTWPILETGTIAAVMAEGQYIVSVTSGEEDSAIVYLWDGNAWTETNEDELDEIMEDSYSDYLVFVGNGEVTVLN